MIIINAILFLVGLILLVKGSDLFVKHASSIATKMGVSEFVIGLTLVSIGTSIPELASSVAASMQQASGIVIGNVVGSNIANIALIVGFAAILSTIKTESEMLRRDGYIMLFSALLLLVFSFDQAISRLESIIFILLYLAYILFLFEEKPKYKGRFYFKEFIVYFYKFGYLTSLKQKMETGINNRKTGNETSVDSKGIRKDLLLIAIGGIAIVAGAKLFIDQSIIFAQMLAVPDTLVGISLVAVGTSLPELMVTISAARKGYGNIAVGNVIGSNITNIFLILGISGLVFPFSVESISILLTTPFMIFMSILLLVFIATNWEIRRSEGIVLIAMYTIFMAATFTLT